VCDSVDPIGDLKAYITLYMKEEVQQEGLVRNIDQFARFLEVISFSQASVINFSSVARECCVSNKTVENYVGILCYPIETFLREVKPNQSLPD
jgi:predicted AAA+ superfamily ATPase